MESSSSRYDLHAEWFLDYTRDWGSVSADYLPDDLGGRRVLDLACGYGTLSRVLAERGAHVTGVDLSARLVAHAQEIDGELGHGSVFVCGDAASTDWWDGRAFSDVVCNMALMDVDDLDKAMSTVATILQPDGRFTFTLFHPCFPGEGETLPSWPPDLGYAAEGWWTTGESGVRGHVGANHRMLSTYLNAVLHAGLEIVEVDEPRTAVPRLLVIHGRRPAGVAGSRA